MTVRQEDYITKSLAKEQTLRETHVKTRITKERQIVASKNGLVVI